MTQLTKQDDEIVYSGFKLLKTGITAIGTPTFEQWQECGEFIKKANGAVHFWIGDWLNYGEKEYGEKYSQVLEETGYDYQTLRNDSYIASRIDLSRRRDNVPFGIYSEIAPFNPDKQEELLDKVVENGMSIKELRKQKHKILLDSVRPTISMDENLILGDAINGLQKIPDNSIDCVVTDPPYGIDYQSNRREVKEQLDRIQNDKAEAFSLLDDVCRNLLPKVKINSHLYFFTSWKVYSKFENIISKYFEIKNMIVWDKGNHGAGDLEGNFGERHELIIFATKGRRILNGSRPENILFFSKVQNLNHPTEKPIGLLENLISLSTDENEVVCDPFMGSGTTCLAAKNIGRKYIGIEIDENWYKLAQSYICGNQNQ